MKNFKFCSSLIIELTEKHPWNHAEIQNLKAVQKLDIEISMDDIHPISTKDNTSMESLTKFKNAGLQVDRHKIDGKFFQEMYDVYVET
jgi:EAL domain-containing protein (putative c-di-GMP-specific phosphodiesterase class I)